MNKLLKLGELTILANQKKELIKEHKLHFLFWEATLSCNCNCLHCGSNCENKKYLDELSTDEIKDAFKQIASNFNPKEIVISVTGGEPLLRKDLYDVMKYASDLGFSWVITTNGILLNEQNVSKLLNTNLRAIGVSIDGLEKTHDKFRNYPDSFNKILGNIKNLQKHNFNGNIEITTVVTKNNINELKDLYSIIKDLDVNIWRIIPMEPIGRALDNKNLLLDKKDLIALLNFIKKNRSKSIKHNKKLNITYGCSSFLGLKYEKEVRKSYFMCGAGINIASILYNGDLFVCPNVKRIPELIQGNIKKDNFYDVWNNKYKQFRDFESKKTDKCKDCKYFDECLGGSYHTWDFENKIQTRCIYDIIH